jgi:hypothetical protein
VFLVLLQSGTGKIPENISKLARHQFSRDRSFTKDLAAKLRVWLKFASGKKSEADFEISQLGPCLSAKKYGHPVISEGCMLRMSA